MKTSCQDCIFATYKDNYRTIQIGCRLGKLDQFEKAGANITRPNSKQNHFTINNRLCLYCRNTKWAKNYNLSEWIDRIKKEICIKYHIIILMTGSLKELIYTLSSITNQSIPPKHITVIRRPKNANVPPGKIGRELDKIIRNWKIQNLIETNSWEQGIDMIIDGNSTPYYCIFTSGYFINPKFSEHLNKLITQDLIQFGTLSHNSELNKFIASTAIHKVLGGNSLGKPLKEKIAEYDKTKNLSIKEYIPCLY